MLTFAVHKKQLFFSIIMLISVKYYYFVLMQSVNIFLISYVFET